MGLKPYDEKRDFRRTSEPPGKVEHSESGRLYLIQKHAARALHYDLRLELNGVLLSWAVPKGPSLDPSEKRLAVHVEDHPVEYGSFEGIIPAGEYGGGTVMLWDRGEWEPEGDPEKGYAKGHLSFRLHGRKLRGGWTLARMGGKRKGEDNWLLIKKSDEEADPEVDILSDDRSVVSGRCMEEIAEAKDLQWRDGGPVPSQGAMPDPSRLQGARRAELPRILSPQLAVPADEVPEGGEWLHEIKFDGYRLLCAVQQGEVRLWTRNSRDWTERFASVALDAKGLPVSSALLDGEVVVLDSRGIADFQALQNVLKGVERGKLIYYAFDLPYCNGYDLARVPLEQRKALLEEILSSLDVPKTSLRFSEHIRGEGGRMYRHACRMGLEGIISKRADSPYVKRRSASWLKIKCVHRQEFVVGGFTEPSGSRAGFGALLLGYYDEKGNLVYSGRVGTGFSDAQLSVLEQDLRSKERKSSPFAHSPRGSAARGVRWVEPELVAEIEFTEWTQDGRLRHPSFQGIREDKSPREVLRERPGKPSPQAFASVTEKKKVPEKVAGIQLSNPDRVMYPAQGVTKGELALYYEQVADRILPFIAGRPLTVVRCPQGQGKKCFYQKHLNDSVPDPVRGVAVKEKEGSGLYLLVDDLPGLITLVQLGVLEFHPWGSRAESIEHPDQIVFDLDPGPGVSWDEVLEGARLVRGRLDALGLRSFVKTSGGKGLHVVVPLVPRAGWEEIKAFSRTVSEDLSRREPGRFVTTMSKSRRQGRIFIDFFRNSRGATSVAPYSTRALPGAPVSTPLAWEELSPQIGPAFFTIENLPARLEKQKDDPWRDFFEIRQTLPIT